MATGFIKHFAALFLSFKRVEQYNIMKSLTGAMLILGFLVIAGTAQASLKDGTNFAMAPEALKCINAEIPDDVGVFGVPATFSLSSDCGEWCDFTSAEVFTDPGNPVSIPICFNTFGKAVNQTKIIKFTADARGKQKEFNYGICVAEQEDQDTGSGNPCAVVSLNQKYFDIRMDPVTYLEPNIEGEYQIEIYSTIRLDMDIEILETGKTLSVTTRPQEKIVVSQKIRTQTDNILNVRAVVRGCALPGCTKTASTLLTVRDPPESLASANFSATLMPESASTKKGQPVKYYLEIRNYGEEKDYAVELSLPRGLKSGFNTTTKTISNRENIIIELEAEGSECSYTFTISVKGQATKTLQGSLSVNEASCDLNRLKTTEALDSKALSDINQAIIRSKDSTLAEDLRSFSDLANKAANKTESVETIQPAQKTSKKAEGGIDLTVLIIVVIVLVALVLFMLLKRRGSQEEADDNYWERAGRY